MKNTQKKKITRNYHLLTKVESGKCRHVTAANDIICHVKVARAWENESAMSFGRSAARDPVMTHNSDHAAAKTVWRLGKFFFLSDHHL